MLASKMSDSNEKNTPLHDLFQHWQADFFCHAGVHLPLRVSGAGTEYEAAQTGAILADGGDRTWICMAGSDLLDFLQRILSSDVEKLEVGSGQWSAMLDGKGHWIADLLVFRLADQAEVAQVWIDCPTSRAETVVQQFDKYHFGEQLHWQIMEVAKLLIAGPNAKELLLPSVGGLTPAEPKFSIAVTADCALIRRPDRGLACWEWSGPKARVVEVAKQLEKAGARPAGWVVLDILRVEAWIPLWGQDFDQASTLPETGEWQRASLSKGCYAGQEVVAKIHTYGQAPRQLCQLEFETGDKPLHGSALCNSNGNQMGLVTSWIWSPRLEKPIGLGVVRRRAIAQNEPLFAHLAQEVFTTTVRAPVKVVS
jgi:glycine cleavage system T protein (aminomethyltransferase)